MIKFLIGGSPCTHWSIARGESRETEARGAGWELFRNYLIAKDKFQPDFFLYENNASAAEAVKTSISEKLKAPLQYINSALVSGQNRSRFYVHNFGSVPQPKDRNVMLGDILESGICDREKATCLLATYGHAGARNYLKKNHGQMVFEPVGGARIYPVGTTISGKAYCVTATYGHAGQIEDTLGRRKRTLVAERTDCTEKGKKIYQVSDGKISHNGNTYRIQIPDGFYIIRPLTVTECCRLQTLPDDYCRAAKKTNAYKGLGNGWTAEVIIHLLSYALAGIPKDEEIVVLSMYDGIGTGRYCFEKLGYKNIRYFAYEIEKSAIEIATSNFPDIAQCGDAFQVRENGYRPPE